jgi:hypothetical protein
LRGEGPEPLSAGRRESKTSRVATAADGVVRASATTTRLLTPDLRGYGAAAAPDSRGLFLDPVAQVRDAGALDHRDGPLELHRCDAELGEQRRTPAQHDRHQLDADLVEQPGFQALPLVAVSSTRGTAGHPFDIRLQDSFSRPPGADVWAAGLATTR